MNENGGDSVPLLFAKTDFDDAGPSLAINAFGRNLLQNLSVTHCDENESIAECFRNKTSKLI
jgi:hypothetical protein